MQTHILTLEPGLQVAVRHRYQSARGTIVVVNKTTVAVRMTTGELRKFAPHSKLEIGSTGHKWMRPYLCTVAEADEADRAHKAAIERVSSRMAAGQSPPWSELKHQSFR